MSADPVSVIRASAPAVAPYPFDGLSAPPDAVLISSDQNECFFIHFDIVSICSPVLHRILDFSPPSLTNCDHIFIETAPVTNQVVDRIPLIHHLVGGIHVIRLGENSQATDRLLRACYPIQQRSFETLGDAELSLFLWDKYKVDELHDVGMQALSTYLNTHAKDALLVFVIAAYFNVVDVAITAAHLSREISLHTLYHTQVPPPYQRHKDTLLAYHAQCGYEVSEVLKCRECYVAQGRFLCVGRPEDGCEYCCSLDPDHPPCCGNNQWWGPKHLWSTMRVAERIGRIQPHKGLSLHTVYDIVCPACGRALPDLLEDFWPVMCDQIEGAVSLVDLPIHTFGEEAATST